MCKMPFPSLWKLHFCLFLKYLSDKLETINWENKENPLNLLKSKVCREKPFKKLFWSDLYVKKECSERLTFLCFFGILSVRMLKYFLGKQRKAFKTIQNKILLQVASKKVVLKLPSEKNWMLLALGKSTFCFLQICEWRSREYSWWENKVRFSE